MRSDLIRVTIFLAAVWVVVTGLVIYFTILNPNSNLPECEDVNRASFQHIILTTITLLFSVVTCIARRDNHNYSRANGNETGDSTTRRINTFFRLTLSDLLYVLI